ncbi:hypothetical protein ACJJTC_010967 [Scirpophaga incertulas]
MDEAFDKLKQSGKNNVDNLIKWMKDAKIIDATQAVEQKARDLFNDAANQQNVELNKFKEVLGKLATEQRKNMEDFAKTLAAEGPKLLNSFGAAVSSFKDALTKK